jgi:hypothetical protein
MNTAEYFRDLSKELSAVQDRIRNLIGSKHWPSDGMWKESVLRTVLRRHLPPSYTVGSGFIIAGNEISTQIDILVCDDSAPVFFRDGDFIIATPGCVRAVVEVKTSLNRAALGKALSKLDTISTLLWRRTAQPFIGLFSYEPIDGGSRLVLDALQKANGQSDNYDIRALCFGDAQFFRFWEFEPKSNTRARHDSWHAYNLPHLARGYFIHNFIEHLFPKGLENEQATWYPPEGKEGGRRDVRQRRVDASAIRSSGTLSHL